MYSVVGAVGSLSASMPSIPTIPTSLGIAKRNSGADSKFFNSSKKGELIELKEELQNPSKDRKRDAVKKVGQNLVLTTTKKKIIPTIFKEYVEKLPLFIVKHKLTPFINSFFIFRDIFTGYSPYDCRQGRFYAFS